MGRLRMSTGCRQGRQNPGSHRGNVLLFVLSVAAMKDRDVTH